MPERKVWSEEEDRVLRMLKEERGQRKWANIARIMESEFGIIGRNGKQCRERYHNHLDNAIVCSEWTKHEQHLLFQLHEEIGNKWSLIAQKLPGRSDNHVKNHFYSKLRKALRSLNKLISQHFSNLHKFIKESTLSRIIKTTESKFKNNSKIDQELAEFCNSIKKRLYRLELNEGDRLEDADFAKSIILDIETFDRDSKKGYKAIKNRFQYEFTTYLKPPSKALRKVSSTLSCSSMKSDDSSCSFLSSNSCSSSSNLSDFDLDCDTIKPAEDKSLRKTSGNNSSDMMKSEHSYTLKASHLEKPEVQNQHLIKRGPFYMEHDFLEESDFYERNSMRDMDYDMICDQTPHIGSIIAPREYAHHPFYLFGKEEDNDEIEFKGDSDKMELQ